MTMHETFTTELQNLALYQPGSAGEVTGPELALARDLGRRRPFVLLAFAPKSAGTFLRHAVIKAIDGQLVRTVHAQGGRDAQLYLPYLLEYFGGGLCPKTLVTHVHMQALPGNINMIEPFGLRPVIMLRSVADMMASYWDMLDHGRQIAEMGVNFHVPADFPKWIKPRKQDFLLDQLLPWHASYFASWYSYTQLHEGALVLRFPDFQAAPVSALEAIVRHAGLAERLPNCGTAHFMTWQKRDELRFNSGTAGRGGHYFTPSQHQRIKKVLSGYAIDPEWMKILAN